MWGFYYVYFFVVEWVWFDFLFEEVEYGCEVGKQFFGLCFVFGQVLEFYWDGVVVVVGVVVFEFFEGVYVD